MKVSDLLASRQTHWQELERLCSRMEGRSKRPVPPGIVSRFSALYRAACADLALADAQQLPPDTIRYLHQLVARAHNQLYRARTFKTDTWAEELFHRVPQRLFADNYLRVAFVIFWGVFMLSAVIAYTTPGYAERALGTAMTEKMEEDFSESIAGRPFDVGAFMAGFYVYHNAGIGLRCFAFGLLFGVGGLCTIAYNAAVLGAVFGHMGTVPQPEHFYHFVTAHGPMELTAIVLSAAAGMRLGFSLVSTGGFRRIASLRLAAVEAMPVMGSAIVMFLLAAMIEAFLSPSPAPYWVKAAVAIITSAMLMFYFIVLGYPREDRGHYPPTTIHQPPTTIH